MTIREATVADLDRLVEMGCHFLAQTAYCDGRALNDPAHIRNLAVMTFDLGVIFVAVDAAGQAQGMLWSIVITHPVLGHRIGTEIVWWVEPEARRGGTGVLLMRAAETWAQERGAIAMQFSALRDAPLERFYRRLGYAAKEVIFEKELGHVEAHSAAPTASVA